MAPLILSSMIDRLITAGVSASEAGAIAAEIYAAGVASASTRSSGAERTRRWRDNKTSQSVTKRHITSHIDDEVQASQNVTERHKASQCDVSAVSPIYTKIKNSKKQNSDRTSRGTRIDPDWKPSPTERLFASQEGLSDFEIDREAARFRDYWKGRAGSGGVKLDWQATWQNWIRTTAEKLGKTPRRPDGSPAGNVLFLAKFGSEELDAWDAYTKTKTGKSMPRDRDGHWRVPAQWPPGYQPREASSYHSEISIPKLQSVAN